MTRHVLVAVAGLPRRIEQEFVQRFIRAPERPRNLQVIASLPQDRDGGFTEAHVSDFYDRVAAKLETLEERHGCILSQSNLIVLYMDGQDRLEHLLLHALGTEALVAPLSVDRPFKVRELVQRAHRALAAARRLVAVIEMQVTRHEGRTCLLLPQRNFGKGARTVFDCVRSAVRRRASPEEFENDVDHVDRSLRSGEGDYCGRDRLIFRAARARHGIAPTWQERGRHLHSCIIRGRMRFGAPYSPKFHYDCEIPHGGPRTFLDCHGTNRRIRRRNHVNIAPNDAVR